MISSCVTLDLRMADTQEPPLPPSETVRVAGDLMEMLRELAFHTRDTRGKRMKLTQIVDNILRPGVVTAHRKLQEEQAKPPTKKKRDH